MSSGPSPHYSRMSVSRAIVMGIGVIQVSERAAREGDGGLGRCGSKNMSRSGAATATSGSDRGVREKHVAFEAATSGRGRARDDSA